jgi:hypothetical protein
MAAVKLQYIAKVAEPKLQWEMLLESLISIVRNSCGCKMHFVSRLLSNN